MTAHAAKLIQAARVARNDAALIAPFIKAEPLRAIISELAPAVTAVAVIARWVPAEIAAGACDLEIYDVVRAHPNARLFVHPLLHAKLYRFDDTAFFGSANLTSKALGLAAPANIELLLSPAESLADLRAFEANLLSSAIEVDAAYRDTIKAQVEALRMQGPQKHPFVAAEIHEVPVEWLPACAAPSRLWNIYSGVEMWRMVEAAADAARQDLAVLSLPPGLTADQFRRNVAAILGCMPLVQKIDDATQRGISAEVAVQMIEAETTPDMRPYGPKETWEVLQKWLLHFFPDRYRTQPAGEILIRNRIIG